MCQSIADGGVRCFAHWTGEGKNEALDATALKKKRRKAKAKGDGAEVKRLEIEYLTTEEGIEMLEDQGRTDLVEAFIRRRNKRIDEYNRDQHKNKPHYVPRSERLGSPAKGTRKPPIWRHDGFNIRPGQKHIHRDTGTLLNPDGFDFIGRHESGDRYHPETGLDWEGYDRAKYHHETGRNRQGFGRDGYDESGFDWSGFSRPDARGRSFDRSGEPREKDGFDAFGWGWSHRSNDFIHEETGTNRNPQGLTFDDDRPNRLERWWV